MHQQIQTYFFLFILLSVGTLAFFMFAPYLQALVLAAAFAVIFGPVYRFQLRMLQGYTGLAAFLTTIIAISAVLVPLIIIGVLIFTDASAMIRSLSATGTADDLMIRLLQQYAPTLVDGIAGYAKQVSSVVASQFGSLLGGILQASISSVIGIIAFFYFLKDGDKFAKALVHISPLEDKYDRIIMSRLEVAVTSVAQGTVIIALVQGVVAGIGLAIFGIPSAALWGSVAAITAMVPTVGTAVVMGPAVLYLLIIDEGARALGLAIWAFVAVGLLDNFLSPYLIGKGVKLHPYLILLSVLGGLQLFGPIGFLLGPLVLSLLFALFDLYPLVVEGHSAISTAKKKVSKT